MRPGTQVVPQWVQALCFGAAPSPRWSRNGGQRLQSQLSMEEAQMIPKANAEPEKSVTKQIFCYLTANATGYGMFSLQFFSS